MAEETQAFLKMAEHDQRLFEYTKTLKQIPLQIDEARKQLDSEQIMLDELQNPWNDYQAQIDEKESTIKLALETITKFEEHMERVNTQKEYMAARKQVDDARRLNTKLQDEILELRMKQEEIDPKLNEVRERYNGVLASFQEQESKLLKDQTKIEKAAQAEQDAIQTMATQVGERVWGYYQRLVSGGRTPAIVSSAGGTCGGCKMTIPPQAYNLVIATPSDFHTCNFCSRILYYDPPKEETPIDEAEEAPKVAAGA